MSSMDAGFCDVELEDVDVIMMRGSTLKVIMSGGGELWLAPVNSLERPSLKKLIALPDRLFEPSVKPYLRELLNDKS